MSVWGSDFFTPTVVPNPVSLTEILCLLSFPVGSHTTYRELKQKLSMEHLFSVKRIMPELTDNLNKLERKRLIVSERNGPTKYRLESEGEVIRKAFSDNKVALRRMLAQKPQARLGPKILTYLAFISMGMSEEDVPISREYRHTCREFLRQIGLLRYKHRWVLHENAKDIVDALCKSGIGNPYYVPPLRTPLNKSRLVQFQRTFRRYIAENLPSEIFRRVIVIYDNSLKLFNGKTIYLEHMGELINCITDAFHDEHRDFSPMNFGQLRSADVEPALHDAERYDLAVWIAPFNQLISQKFYDLLRQRESLSKCAILRLFHFHEGIALAIDIDYQSLTNACTNLAKVLERASTVNLTTNDGTKLTLYLKDRGVHMVTGTFSEQERITRLPAGEVFISPARVGTEGEVVLGKNARINGTSRHMQARLQISNGKISDVKTRDSILESYMDELRNYSPLMLNLSEIGIGLNPKANPKLTRELCPSLCSVALGYVHLAFGFSEPIGGPNRSHGNEYWMLTIRKPTLATETGETILSNGVLRIYDSKSQLPLVMGPQ